MRDQDTSNASNSGTNLPNAQSGSRVVIAYDDLATGERVMRTLAEVASKLGETVEFQSFPWSFDLLADVDWSDVAASKEVRADLLIVASEDENPLPPPGAWWDDIGAHSHHGMPSAMLARFGSIDGSARSNSLRCEALQGAANKAGFHVFMPSSWSGPDEFNAQIHLRAQRVTPVLEEILERIDKKL